MKKLIVFLLLGAAVLAGCQTSTTTSAVSAVTDGYVTPPGINAVPSN